MLFRSIFPETVIERAIANAAMLARRSVIATEKHETIKLFRAGTKTPPESNKRLKVLRFRLSGNANGSVMILRSDLNAPKMTIEHGTKITTVKIVSIVARMDLYNITSPHSPNAVFDAASK